MSDSCFRAGRAHPPQLRLGRKVNTLHSLNLRNAYFISLSRNRVSASLFLYRTFRTLSGVHENKVAECTHIRSSTMTGAVGRAQCTKFPTPSAPPIARMARLSWMYDRDRCSTSTWLDQESWSF